MNLNTTVVGVNTVISLLEFRFSANDIAVIVFYQAQSKTYKVALRLASQALHNRALQDVRVRKMDEYQGEEASIVILDFAITTVPGFVHDRNRLTVAIIRQRDGLIIIADEVPVEGGSTRYTPGPIKPPAHTSVGTSIMEEGQQDVPMTEADLSAFPAGDDRQEETGEGSGTVRNDYIEIPINDAFEQAATEPAGEEQETEIKSESIESAESTESETTTDQAQQDSSQPMDQTE
ncbi:MAG: hypothetical protein M1826_003911 [Phylliscum demangeonii]|nr:MAG: hypothetical protein M1826_003911 [Phylliscum demangeonii]